jgi:hypothetical protein
MLERSSRTIQGAQVFNTTFSIGENMKSPLFLLICLAILTTLGLGCSKSTSSQPEIANTATKSNIPDTKIVTGPGDPKLTYELVTQDVNAYKGKRVRWCGNQVSASAEIEKSGRGICRAVYLNVEKWEAGGDIQAFAVEYISDDMLSVMQKDEGCVTGTIEGTQTVDIERGSSSGSKSGSNQVVPVLSNPEFEEDKNKIKK